MEKKEKKEDEVGEKMQKKVLDGGEDRGGEVRQAHRGWKRR